MKESCSFFWRAPSSSYCRAKYCIAFLLAVDRYPTSAMGIVQSVNIVRDPNTPLEACIMRLRRFIRADFMYVFGTGLHALH